MPRNHEVNLSAIRLSHIHTMVETIQQHPVFQERMDREFIHQFLFHADHVVERMNELEPNPDQQRTGAILVVAEPGDNSFISIHEVGKAQGTGKPDSPFELDHDKPSKYVANVLGKVAKLVLHPDLKASSIDTPASKSEPLFVETALRDGTQDKHPTKKGEPRKVVGGAIRWTIHGKDMIFACSGYNAMDDEAVILATLVRMRVMSSKEAMALAKEIGNTEYEHKMQYLLMQKRKK